MVPNLDDDIFVIAYNGWDVEAFAQEAGVDLQTAYERAVDWADDIRATAQNLINEQLRSVIRTNNP